MVLSGSEDVKSVLKPLQINLKRLIAQLPNFIASS